jgi:hypothetical protein
MPLNGLAPLRHHPGDSCSRFAAAARRNFPRTSIPAIVCSAQPWDRHMALIRETGEGLADASCYADAAYAEAFHAEPGTIDAWQAFVEAGAAKGALHAASEMLDARYVWCGVILNADQALKLPREPFLDPDFRLITPAQQIAKAADACALLALRLAQDPPAGGANITSERFPDYQISYARGGKRVDFGDVHATVSGMVAAGGLSQGMRNVPPGPHRAPNGACNGVVTAPARGRAPVPGRTP